jgi:hypothetical protein
MAASSPSPPRIDEGSGAAETEKASCCGGSGGTHPLPLFCKVEVEAPTLEFSSYQAAEVVGLLAEAVNQ